MNALKGLFCVHAAVVILMTVLMGGGAAPAKQDQFAAEVGKTGQTVKGEDRDFGDAPEGAVAYPSTGVFGLFPTCVGVGPAAWIEHGTQSIYLGPKADLERDGNAGTCPAFAPDLYNQDEGMNDGDAGLLKPRAYTIKGSPGAQDVRPLALAGLESLGSVCLNAAWGTNIDIEVHNSAGRQAYVNVLMDWNQDGVWQGSSRCPDGEAPEHVLVNFPVPSGYSGPLSGLRPGEFKIGPQAGYAWARFTISEQPVVRGWGGDGIFADGETEDYLLQVGQGEPSCGWSEGDPHVMHWAQLPDLRATGTDIDMSWGSLADDFRCARNGPITDIHFWGSFKDDALPRAGVDSLTFAVSVYSDKPADSTTPWSRPDKLLWSRQIRAGGYEVQEVPSTVAEGWFEPIRRLYQPTNHKRVFRYDICLNPGAGLFTQSLGTVYWLEIKEVPGADSSYAFGWKTTVRELQFNDAAAWRNPTLGWMSMIYPDRHDYSSKPMDLAFVVTGGAPEEMDFGDAPDPTYPTLSINSGAQHAIVPGVYLGKGVDAEADGQPDATATGDDLRGDDEDGVVFTSALVPGETTDIDVTASAQGALNTWIDWNADGDWDDAGEHVFVDESLGAGVNTLTLNVPARAVPGRTFARFRFSRTRGLAYNGPASDGEVEDYQVQIADVVVPAKPPVEHLKWSQPPIEKDPASKRPVYCGWDEPAHAVKASASAATSWNLVADNFRCPGNMPVTSVHWWGSYQTWQGDEAPRIKPESWRIGFWSNVPAGSQYKFGRPGKLLWVVNASTTRVEEEKAGTGGFPQKPSDTIFQYLLRLQSPEYFWQSRFVDSDTCDRIFWVSITAVYSGSPGPQNPWGWTTRPRPWADGAVKAQFKRDDLRAGFSLDSSTAGPITSPLACERQDTYDMAFELNTAPEYINWEQPFTGLRHWANYEDEESFATEGAVATAKWTQPPDATSTGVDVDITRDMPMTWPSTVCADDFECKTAGPITGITLWASWYRDVLPGGSAENVTFTLSIRQDIPANRSSTGYSTPGKVLWRKEFSRGEFIVEPVDSRAQSYYSAANEVFERNNHLSAYRYTFTIDASKAFQQTGADKSPVVYWLTAQARVIHAPGSVATRFGWTASSSHWNDAAVWVKADEPYDGTTWAQVKYPKGHSLSGKAIDLAFAIETQKAGTTPAFRRIVADDWRCSSNLPVSGIVWWGSYIGYGYLPCDCQQMAAPKQPDYFLLSVWTDVPDPDLKDPRDFSHPGRKLWEYKAERFDEVLVGFDRNPEPTGSSVRGFEPVYRYTVRLPQDTWFRQDSANGVCWLSVVAVHKDSKAVVYPWGWTNHPSNSWDRQTLTPLAHWKLDETAGKVAADSSAGGNHGTVFGNPIWRPAGGWIDGALDLDGRGDYIKVEKPKGFDFAPNSFSVSTWIYPRETRGWWHGIMEYDRDGVNRNRFGLWLDAEGRFHFRVGQNTWHSQQSLTPGQWYHLAATFDADTQTMSLYVNGMFEGAATYQRGFSLPMLTTLIIGARGSADDEYFNGLIDDVRVFRTSLTAEEVLTLAGVGRNDGAVAAQPSAGSAVETWAWTQLLDQTGLTEDLSFMLFTEPVKALSVDDSDDDGDTEIIIPSREEKK